MITVKTKAEVIQSLKEIWGIDKNVELAEYLGATRQSINTYLNVGEGAREDIQRKIITRLLEHIEKLESQLPSDQDKIRLVVLEELAKQKG